MRFLFDECLHTSLVEVAVARGHVAWHVTWLGLSGEPDWDLVRRAVTNDLTFVTNNAHDFRRLYAREPLHAGLVIMVPQVAPVRQRVLFAGLLATLGDDEQLVNEAVEIEIDNDEIVTSRYAFPASEGN